MKKSSIYYGNKVYFSGKGKVPPLFPLEEHRPCAVFPAIRRRKTESDSLLPIGCLSASVVFFSSSTFRKIKIMFSFHRLINKLHIQKVFNMHIGNKLYSRNGSFYHYGSIWMTHERVPRPTWTFRKANLINTFIIIVIINCYIMLYFFPRIVY